MFGDINNQFIFCEMFNDESTIRSLIEFLPIIKNVLGPYLLSIAGNFISKYHDNSFDIIFHHLLQSSFKVLLGNLVYEITTIKPYFFIGICTDKENNDTVILVIGIYFTCLSISPYTTITIRGCLSCWYLLFHQDHNTKE